MRDWTPYIPLMLQGLLVTVQLTLLSAFFAVIIAFVAGIGRASPYRTLRLAATAYVEFFRGTSIFVQLFWAYYVLPLLGLSLSPLFAGVAVLSLNVALMVRRWCAGRSRRSAATSARPAVP